MMWQPRIGGAAAIVYQGVMSDSINRGRSDVIGSFVVDMQMNQKDIKTSDLEANIDARKVYDKLRGEWRYSSKNSQEGGQDESAVELPRESETLNDRVSRLLDEESCASETVPPSTRSSTVKGLFHPSESSFIIETCKNIISSGPISQDCTKKALGCSPEGMAILKRVNINQILTRLNYKRQKPQLNN
ncbi:UNVERIFIED_CONTAM: hypothetical protein FKN15_071169 [Acipenser sinensis]